MENPSRIAPARLYVLDGLRLVAALLVVAFHFTVFSRPWGVPNGAALPAVVPVTQFGWLGVYLFFLISGFVICMSAEGRGLAQFATARITRLYPAYWFAVLATTAVVALWPVVTRPLRPGDVLTNLTMFQELLGVPSVDVVYWTLTVELRFYLLFGVFVLLRGYTPRRVLLFAAGWLVAGLFAADVPLLAKLLVPRDSAFFVAGMALYLIYRHGGNLYLWGLVGASWLVALEMVSTVTPRGPVHNPFSPTEVAIVEAGLVTLFFLIIAGVATHRLAVGWRWLTLAGALTYPLYLLHEYVGWTMIHYVRAVLPPWAAVLVVLAALLVISWLVYRYVEKPLSGWLRRRFRASRLPATFLQQPPADRPPSQGTGSTSVPRQSEHRSPVTDGALALIPRSNSH
ncbi:acyltransferase [Micromonospora sp. DR5-3]|uniref:acyltransferase family protein n=1 Tax=unclassified Micromonospora TaxID=2617518 RepID=UPI0021057E21|nr:MULTISPECIES: acyltransferase [unclassified Micromonospora]MCW3814987.1 acyltransferase [Micromonospora sp. DR5-3]